MPISFTANARRSSAWSCGRASRRASCGRPGVRWPVAPGTHAAPIPQLLLHPRIEDALVHGIASSLEGGWIEVQAGVRDGRLQVLIRNTVGGRSQPGLGVGIANARARLK